MLTIVDFSGIYVRQKFYAGKQASWIDAREITGTNCYCDEEACASLREKIRDFPAEGIHFIDSGNYHYMSKIWMEKIREPFDLLVFDNHTDMQPPAFGGILSCGGWIASALGELENLRRVVLAGPGEEEFHGDLAALKKREDSVFLFSRERLEEGSLEKLIPFLEKLDGSFPLYLSIDKDFLCKEDACTAWSQGNGRLKELAGFLRVFGEKIRQKGFRVIGADICGECPPDDTGRGLERNDRANRALLEALERWVFL